mmetsp:Transcript_5000/g.12078  ORF Transcript_5000/g.12078 Transcript_5000/m.12078 type:complete len:233 (-) Transcript_5000:791-1489(-)
MSLQEFSGRVERLVSKGKTGSVAVKEEGERLAVELKKAVRAADRKEKPQLDRLLRIVTDFLKAFRPSQSSAFSPDEGPSFQSSPSNAVSSGSRGAHLNVEEEGERRGGNWMKEEFLKEDAEVEYKLEMHEARAVELRKIHEDSQQLQGCIQEMGKLLAQQGDHITQVEDDIQEGTARVRSSSKQIASAGKARAGKRQVEGAVVSGVVGAAIGIVAGPVGVIAGGAAGAGLGG